MLSSAACSFGRPLRTLSGSRLRVGGSLRRFGEHRSRASCQTSFGKGAVNRCTSGMTAPTETITRRSGYSNRSAVAVEQPVRYKVPSDL
jgi:hypothetical protein